MSLRWVIAGGGTGGHVTPALALGEVIRESGDWLHFVGTRRGIEGRLVPQAGFVLTTLASKPFVGRGPLDLLRAGGALLLTSFQAWRLLRRERVDLVISVGGYASAPAAIAALLARVPMVLVNTDAVPGAANRLLARFARRIYAGFPATARTLGRGDDDERILVTGVPLRRALRLAFASHGNREGDDRIHLFAFGGSQGARQINDALVSALPRLDPARIAVVHQTGEADRERVARAYRAAGFQAEVLAFEAEMPARYRWADLVVCRSGAISVAELTLAGRPALLIPLAHVGGGEQFANAAELERAGAAQVLESRAFSQKHFEELLLELLEHPEKLRAMGRQAAGLARPDAALEIVTDCRRLVAAPE